MNDKTKWFAAGFLARSLLSDGKKNETPAHREEKQKKWEDYLSSHPLITLASFIFAVGFVAVCLVAMLKG